MRLLIFLSIIGLGHSIDLSSVFEIDELMVFIKGAESRLSEAADELKNLEIEETNNYAGIIDKYLLKVKHTDEDDKKYQKLKDLVKKIDQVWNDLGTKDLGDDDKTQLDDLAKTRDELYDHFVGNGTTKGLPAEIAYAKEPNLCELTMPEQFRLNKIHQAVALSELRAFILGLKAGEDNKKAVAKGIMQSEQYILSSRLGFVRTEDRFRACDPPEHIRGKTFGEFLGFVQGVLVNDGHTNNRIGTGSCGTSCDELDEKRIDRCYKKRDGMSTSYHCHTKQCLGKLVGCIHVKSAIGCELSVQSDRRFSWVYGKRTEKMWGKSGPCEGTKADVWESRVGFGNTCLTCLCLCVEEDQTSKATRTVSLIPQFADIQKNMVVTGVRFQEKKKMFHVQIEESKLGPLGEIVPGTSKWKKLNIFTYDQKSGTFQMNNGLRKKQLFDDFDYKMLNRDSRSFNLDKVKTNYGDVIVGVSLAYSDEEDVLQIQILSWPFDFKTGELKNPVDLKDEDMEHAWINWENTPRKPDTYKNPRFRILIEPLDDPALAPNNFVLSDPNDQVKVTATGYGLDMAQHTIPYITLQDVTYSDKKSALGGLELYYARAKGYGGFLGFRIQSYDFSKEFQNEMTQEDIDKYRADFDGQLPREIPVKDM